MADFQGGGAFCREQIKHTTVHSIGLALTFRVLLFCRRMLLVDVGAECQFLIASHCPRLLLTCRTLYMVLQNCAWRKVFPLASLHGRVWRRRSGKLVSEKWATKAHIIPPPFVDDAFSTIGMGYWFGWALNKEGWPIRLTFMPESLEKHLLGYIQDIPHDPVRRMDVEMTFYWSENPCLEIEFSASRVDMVTVHSGELAAVTEYRYHEDIPRAITLEALHGMLRRRRVVRFPLFTGKVMECNGLLKRISVARMCDLDDINRRAVKVAEFYWLPMAVQSDG